MRHLALSLMMACALAACGGGGGADGPTEAGAATTSEPASAAAQSGAAGDGSDTVAPGTSSEPVADGSASNPSRFVPGTYVGHWLGYQYGLYSGMSAFTAGGSLLRFSTESYGKLKAVGAADVASGETTQTQVNSDRLSIGLAGDLYSDNNVYALGTSFHLFNELVSGTYDPARKRLALTVAPQAESGHYLDNCKTCNRVYYLPGRVYAFYSPVGTSSPAGFRLSRSADQLSWPDAAGVEHWMVSVFEEDEARSLGQDAVTPSTLPYPSAAGATWIPTYTFHYQEFGEKMMLPAAARSVTLPSLVKGKRYVGVISGFGALHGLYGINEAAAYSSVRWTAH